MSRPAVTPVHGCLNVVATVSKEVVQGMPPQMGQLVVTGAVPLGENGEV
jgi:hypothetical protein